MKKRIRVANVEWKVVKRKAAVVINREYLK